MVSLTIFVVNSEYRMICIDNIVNPTICLMVCLHEYNYVIVIR